MAEEKETISVTNTRWYPSYHVAAPSGWINDPNGFCVYKGQYHLFYQHFPYDVKWGPMHWGHVVSDDLTHWKHLPIALEPTTPYEEGGGCFSGSAIEKDGKLYLMYTGHSNIETQNFAVSDDGINFTKIQGNPVIYAPPENIGDINAADFRDPKVWQRGDKYYCVIGSKTKDGAVGQVLLYEFENLIGWNFKNIMARSEGNEGNMWECPNFAEIDGTDVLIMSPIGIQPEGNKFLNLSQAGYMLGKLDYDTGIFEHGAFEMLDYGFDFYAPQITQTADGRTILIAWLDMWGGRFPEEVDGWTGMMSIPREIHVKNGKIISTPVKELEKLRLGKKSYSNLNITERKSFDGVSGETGELLATIDAKKSFEIELRSNGEEKTLLIFDAENNIFKINREKSGENIGGNCEREVKINPAKEINLQIFIDRSSVEIFINDGEAVISARIYPQTDSQGIYFVPSAEKFKIKKLTFYTLGEGIPQPEIK